MISFLLSYLSLYSNVSAAEPVVQNLEYALSVADQQIGTRSVKKQHTLLMIRTNKPVVVL